MTGEEFDYRDRIVSDPAILVGKPTIKGGQIRAMITVAGNPTVSTPNAGRLARALESLEFMVSLDIYVNETTRHANLILPAPSPLQRSHFDLALYNFSARNVANYSPPVFPLDDGTPDEWETLLRLTAIVAGQGADADVDALDRMVAEGLLQRDMSLPGSRLAGRDERRGIGVHATSSVHQELPRFVTFSPSRCAR